MKQSSQGETVREARFWTGIENAIIYCSQHCQFRWNARQEKRQTVAFQFQALFFSLLKRKSHPHRYKHTKDVFQAVSVKIYRSPVRGEHMEQSSNFQLLSWSFSLSPTRFLCVMWDCVSELAVALWTLGCKAELFSKLPFFQRLEVRGANIFVSSQCCQYRERLCKQLGKQTMIASTWERGIYVLHRGQTHGFLCQDEHAYVCNHALMHKRLPVTQIASCISACLIISRSFFMLNPFKLNKLTR